MIVVVSTAKKYFIFPHFLVHLVATQCLTTCPNPLQILNILVYITIINYNKTSVREK